MLITITMDTDHPEAFDTLKADLEGMLRAGEDINSVRITESVYEGTSPRREWDRRGRQLTQKSGGGAEEPNPAPPPGLRGVRQR